MKNFKILFLVVSFLFFSGTLFSQIKPAKKEIKVHKISKKNIKLRSYTIKNNSLKVDGIENMTIDEINGLNIPKIEPINPKVLKIYTAKPYVTNNLNIIEPQTSWEITPTKLIDGDFKFYRMGNGSLTPDEFNLRPELKYTPNRWGNLENWVSQTRIDFTFKGNKGDLYLLEISISPKSHTYSENDNNNGSVIVGVNQTYQSHRIVDGKVNVVFSFDTNSTSLKSWISLRQEIPDSDDIPHQMLKKLIITSIKLRNITE